MGILHRFDLVNIREKRNINTFIETGTLHGEGVDFALHSGFTKVISIDIDENIVNLARAKYKNNDKVEILLGNSTDVLKEICPKINEPVIFWLDAHFPGVDSPHASEFKDVPREIKVPLEYELQIIKERNMPDVIICDDLWVYEDWKTSTGTFNEHCKAHGHNLRREDFNTDGLLDGFEDMFKNTHNMSKHYFEQGYLVFTPQKNV